jgi:plastocyanin
MRSISRLVVPALAVASLVVVLACPASAATANVSITDNQYTPATVTINVGDTVTWTDNGSAHSVTSDDGTSFDSSPNCPSTCLANGDTFSHTFSSAGSFGYHCRLHGSAMTGTVVVQAPATTTSSTTATSSTTTSIVTTTSSTIRVGGLSDSPTTVVVAGTNPRFTG